MSTILITGASSGLGAEMARQFAARDTTSRSARGVPNGSTELREEIPRPPRTAPVELRALDVNDDAQVFEVFHAFRDDFGRLDRVWSTPASARARPSAPAATRPTARRR